MCKTSIPRNHRWPKWNPSISKSIRLRGNFSVNTYLLQPTRLPMTLCNHRVMAVALTCMQNGWDAVAILKLGWTRWLELPNKGGLATKFAKELGIEPRVAQRWWENYKAKEEMPYKKSIVSNGSKNIFINKHDNQIKQIGQWRSAVSRRGYYLKTSCSVRGI